MNAMDLYHATSRALKTGDLEAAAELLPKLTVKLEAPPAFRMITGDGQIIEAVGARPGEEGDSGPDPHGQWCRRRRRRHAGQPIHGTLPDR